MLAPAGCWRFRWVRERQERFVRSESRQSGSLRDRSAPDGVVDGPSTRNEHVTAVNHHIQNTRLLNGDLDPATATPIAAGAVMVGDVVATRRNDRRLRTTTGDTVRNRHRWIVTHTSDAGVTVTRLGGHGTVTLPTGYVRRHVELAYATSEHGAPKAKPPTAASPSPPTQPAGAKLGRGTRATPCAYGLST